MEYILLRGFLSKTGKISRSSSERLSSDRSASSHLRGLMMSTHSFPMGRHEDSWTCITISKIILQSVEYRILFIFLMHFALFPILIVLLILPEMTFAVPPPDFIIQAVSQLALIFSLSVAFLSSIFFAFREYIRICIRQYRWLWHGMIFLGIIILSLLLAWWGNEYYQSRVSVEIQDSWKEHNSSHEKPIQIATNTGNISWELQSVSSGSEMIPWTGSLSLTNPELLSLMQSGRLFLLDARENLEYDIGRIPTSIHIRFADLKEGKWISLPSDTKIVVVCWSGMRGEEVAEYLRWQWKDAYFLEHGVDGWVTYGWSWTGEVKFSHVYNAKNYSLTFTTDEVLSQVSRWVRLIDARESEKYDKHHIIGVPNISLLATPSDQIDHLLGQVSRWETVIIGCDGYINCFDAKIVGIELEKRWVIFLWRYPKPWEYPNTVIPHI